MIQDQSGLSGTSWRLLYIIIIFLVYNWWFYKGFVLSSFIQNMFCVFHLLLWLYTSKFHLRAQLFCWLRILEVLHRLPKSWAACPVTCQGILISKALTLFLDALVVELYVVFGIIYFILILIGRHRHLHHVVCLWKPLIALWVNQLTALRR